MKYPADMLESLIREAHGVLTGEPELNDRDARWYLVNREWGDRICLGMAYTPSDLLRARVDFAKRILDSAANTD